MKRSRMGLALLLVLLMGSIAVTRAMERIHSPMEQELNLAARYAMAGDWNNAGALFRQVRDSWKKWEHFRACFADHSPMEEIDGLFAEMEIFAAAEEQVHFAATCAALSERMEAMADAHSLGWWNLF